MEWLLKINGIGKVHAEELLKQGVTKRSDLKKKKYFETLSKEAQSYVIHKPLIKIPREQINEFLSFITPRIKGKWDVAGSYRRELPFSSDVDIITMDIEDFKKQLLSLFEIDIYSEGDSKFSGIIYGIKQPHKLLHTKSFKIDVWGNMGEYSALLLHATGSAYFNIRTRTHAKKLGYLLNEKGLFKDGKLIKLNSEKEILEKIGLKYIEPKNRK